MSEPRPPSQLHARQSVEPWLAAPAIDPIDGAEPANGSTGIATDARLQKPIILKAADLPDWTTKELNALFTVLELPAEAATAAALLREHGAAIRGVALRKTRVDAALLDARAAREIRSGR